METCQYKAVNVNTDEEDKIETIKERPGSPFLRQLLVCSGVWATYFIAGLSFGAPTVIIPREKSNPNTTILISSEMATWLSSLHGYAALPWVFLLPVTMHYYGRKLPFSFACVVALVGFIFFYCSNSAIHILISELFMGVVFSSNMTVSIIIVAEYTSPKYRGMFLTVKSATFFWGIWAANALGTFVHWKNIGIMAFSCLAYTATVVLWPESPYWLAMKGRFNECAHAHHWLKGYDEESERELEALINGQKEIMKNTIHRMSFSSGRLIGFAKTFTLKEFYKPILLSMGMMATYQFSGKLVCTMYSVELIKRITKNENTAYMGMLILDAVTVTGMYGGCVLSRYLKRRTLLFTSTIIGICFLFIMSLYMYLIKLQVISEINILSITLLTAFSVTISCGPMILSSSIYGELTPLRFKSLAIITISTISYIMMGTILKISPYLFKAFDLHGTFLFYGISSGIFTFILFRYLPETKDKTLQEIEDFLKK